MTYLDTVVSGELAALRGAKASRNVQLFKNAARLYQFVPSGALDETELTTTLESEARALGLDRQEIKDTLRSARKAGYSDPATVPGHTRLSAAQARPIEAPEPCDPPSEAWQAAARGFLDYAQDRLWGDDTTGLDTLEARGLNPLTVVNAGFGYNPTRLLRSRKRWGLGPDADHWDDLYLPAGVVIPYIVEQQISKIEIRTASGKYTIPGSSNALWGADRITARRPAMLVEGVLNALTVKQEAGDLVSVAAIGAATHARRVRWIVALSRAPKVLIATDAGQAGEDAASYWLGVLGASAARWRPYTDDQNAMLRAGLDVRAWVQAGLEANP